MMTKRSSAGLLLLLLTFILNLSLSLQTSIRHRPLVHVPKEMNQSEARQYCREHHSDLAAFRNKSEFLSMGNPGCGAVHCWIDLERNPSSIDAWYWSDGNETSTNYWSPIFNVLNEEGEEYCAATGLHYWYDYRCEKPLKALCTENELILVKEMKTWREALDHCRDLERDPDRNTYFDHVYDLPHINFGSNNLWPQKVVRDAQTPELWIGLRFLAGNWLWVNGYPLWEQLPSCPAPNMHCGTMSKTGEVRHSRDCSERRNFLCG